MNTRNNINAFAPRKDDIVRSEKEALEDLAKYDAPKKERSQEQTLDETVKTQEYVHDLLLVADGTSLRCYDPVDDCSKVIYENDGGYIHGIAVDGNEIYLALADGDKGLFGKLSPEFNNFIELEKQNNFIYDLATFDGKIVYGGSFSRKGIFSKKIYPLRSYDVANDSFEEVANEVDSIKAICMPSKNIYYGGDFSENGKYSLMLCNPSKNTSSTFLRAENSITAIAFFCGTILFSSSGTVYYDHTSDRVFDIAEENNEIYAMANFGREIAYGGDFTKKGRFPLRLLDPIEKTVRTLTSFKNPIHAIAPVPRIAFEYLLNSDSDDGEVYSDGEK